MTTFVLSMFNAHLVNTGGEPVVLGLALAYGGIAQLLAGMWEFRTGNTFGAVAFSSYGAFWISFWALIVFYVHSVPAAAANHSIGLYLYAWAIFTAYMTVAALRTSGAVLLVLALLTATYVLLAIGATGAHLTVTKWGGYVGIATAAAAWYASFAQVINSTFSRTVLPIVPLAPPAPTIGRGV
jgi:succinate-acetate transporter protein